MRIFDALAVNRLLRCELGLEAFFRDAGRALAKALGVEGSRLRCSERSDHENKQGHQPQVQSRPRLHFRPPVVVTTAEREPVIGVTGRSDGCEDDWPGASWKRFRFSRFKCSLNAFSAFLLLVASVTTRAQS